MGIEWATWIRWVDVELIAWVGRGGLGIGAGGQCSGVWLLNGRRGFAGWAWFNCMDCTVENPPIYKRTWDQHSGLGGLGCMEFAAA